MIIQKIKITNFENISGCEVNFGPEMSVVSGQKSRTVADAIGVILKHKEIVKKIKDFSQDTQIEAVIDICGQTYLIAAKGMEKEKKFSYEIISDRNISEEEFYHLIERNSEEENLNWFLTENRNIFPDKFKLYKDPNKYYSPEYFSFITNGIGETRTFRVCLNKYLQHYQSEMLSKNKNIFVGLTPEGRFVAENGKTLKEVELNHSDKKMFEFICFLNVNEFWKQIEEIRDLHYDTMPFIISTTTETATKIIPYLRKTRDKKRQALIFVTSEFEEDKNCRAS